MATELLSAALAKRGWFTSVRMKTPGGRRMAPVIKLRNRAKKSVTLNLADPRVREIARRPVARAQVLVEGFRPGVVARLGVGFEAIHAWNPALV